MSIVSTFYYKISDMFGFFKQTDEFQRDLEFVQKTLLENHPGIHDSLNPNFSTQLAKSYKIAKEQLNRVNSTEDKILVLKDFGKSFLDAHLWVQYDAPKPQAVSKPDNPSQVFSLQKLKNGLTWINIPTFAPSKDQLPTLHKITQRLPELRKETLVFDLRGNGGGNSALGTDLLNSLFGADYAKYCSEMMSRNTYVEWRASPGNLEHVENMIIPMVKKQFESGHPAIQWAENTCIGMKKAIAQGSHYYSESKEMSEPLPKEGPTSLFEGKIIAIVDRRCGSACLNFIDGLKAMQPNITLVGEETGADSNYMELRKVTLPSGNGTFGFPIKVYRDRPRGHNVPFSPDIKYDGNLKNTLELQTFISNIS